MSSKRDLSFLQKRPISKALSIYYVKSLCNYFSEFVPAAVLRPAYQKEKKRKKEEKKKEFVPGTQIAAVLRLEPQSPVSE